MPSNQGFGNWFDELSIKELEELWKTEELKIKVMQRLRHPGGMHEWLLVSRAPTFKLWRVGTKEIKAFRTNINEVIFVNPSGKHGGLGSTRAHNELLKLIDSSKDFHDYKKSLNFWADNRLQGGRRSLPQGLIIY